MSDDLITLKIKQTNNNQTFDVKVMQSQTVLELKKECSETSGLSDSQQNLVYKGRILADEKLVGDYNIQEGHTIILVKKVSQEEKDKSKSTTTTSTEPTGTGSNVNSGMNNNFGMFGQGGGLGSFPDLSSMGGVGGSGMDLNTAMSMMNNPMYQQLMSQV